MKLTQEDQGNSPHVHRADSMMQKRFPISAATLIAIPLMMVGGAANADQGIHRGQDKEQFRKSVNEFYNWAPQVRAADCPVGKHWATAPGGGIAQCVANPIAPSGGFFGGFGGFAGSDSGPGGGSYYVSDGGDTGGPGDAPSSPGSAPGSCGPGTAGTCDAAAADAGASSDAGDGAGGDAGGGDSGGGGGDGGGGDGGGDGA